MFDAGKGVKIEDALNYTTTLKKEYNINSFLIYRLQINGQDLHDCTDWSQYGRPILNFKYQLKPSDPVRLIAQEEFMKLQDIIDYHKETIRKTLEQRLDQLMKKYEEFNAPKNKFINFFKGNTPTEKTYAGEEIQFR